jgi:hypothetical protein
LSWDVILMPVPPGVERMADVPEDHRAAPLGTHDEVMARLRDALPGVVFSEASRGLVRGEDYSLELNLGTGALVKAVIAHVQGGEAALPAIRRAAEALGVSALHCGSGALLRFDASTVEDVRRWTAEFERLVEPPAPTPDAPE